MIQLNDDWKIDTDPLNIILKRRIISKKGDVYWKNVGYYNTFERAIKDIVKKEILEVEPFNFSIVCNKIDKLYKVIDGLRSEVTNLKEEDLER